MQDKTSKFHLFPKWSGHQRRIGITGGIACGKSSVGNYLAKNKKLPIIDADVFSKEILSPGTSSTAKIIKRYGDIIINNTTGAADTINRLALRKIIFNNKTEKIWLEELIHPLIIKRINLEIEKLNLEPVIVMIIPLLFELNLTELCSEIWLIECTLNQQISRLMKRDKINKEIAIKIIKSQISTHKKKKLVDIIIDNKKEPRLWVDQIDGLI